MKQVLVVRNRRHRAQRGGCTRQDLAQQLADRTSSRHLPTGPPIFSVQEYRSDVHCHGMQTLELNGGEHAGISEAAKGLHNVDIIGQENECDVYHHDCRFWSSWVASTLASQRPPRACTT